MTKIKQIKREFYFSNDNLSKDLFLKNKSDRNGYIHMDILLNFPRLKYNLVSPSLLAEVFDFKSLYIINY